MTSSCQDLWRKGHTLSGLYSVMGNAMIETVYCDFSKLPSDSGIKIIYLKTKTRIKLKLVLQVCRRGEKKSKIKKK